MQHVYFIDTGLVSVGAKVGPQKFVEVWLIGAEELVGIPLALTTSTLPIHRRTVQVAGAANRGSLNRRLLAYRRSVLWCTPISLLSSFRLLNQRRVIRLINCGSALGDGSCSLAMPWSPDEIPLTHQMLAQLLGVRRARVTDWLLQLKKEGLIEMMRGRLVIRDALRLAQISCDCWGLIERKYERHHQNLYTPKQRIVGTKDWLTACDAKLKWPTTADVAVGLQFAICSFNH